MDISSSIHAHKTVDIYIVGDDYVYIRSVCTITIGISTYTHTYIHRRLPYHKRLH